MFLYHSSKSSKKVNSVFNHLAISPIAPAERIESMFTHQNRYLVDKDYSIQLLDINGKIIKKITLEQQLISFCNFVKNYSIFKYNVKAENPLRLIDLWEDDPIGSGGPNVVDHNYLNEQEIIEIKSLFHPFNNIIYPEDVYQSFTKKDIKNIKRTYLTNTFFSSEFNKRKDRAKAINEDFNISQNQEIVWLDLSFKLRSWALGKGYDSFVYTNKKEGNNEDTYITLLPEQLEYTNERFIFQEEKYLLEIKDLIKEIIDKQYSKSINNSSIIINHYLLWAQKNPMPYWNLL
ncbi:hypothetical protein [Proteus alimentorum]|uniref:hypothetical protein n=1 Tax=Proteus alimentorum TaxID=1973495 RepID=UPI000BFFCF07|nr:hypothetical protein [Proteus alimentorum]